MDAVEMAHGRRIVKIRTGTQDPGTGNRFAEVVSLANFPTFHLVGPDGHHYPWAVHLCDEASAEEAIQYWRERAITAEKLVEEKDKAAEHVRRYACGHCGKNISPSLWGWCSVECLQSMEGE